MEGGLPLAAAARVASFAEQGDARDHLFVQDAHLPPRFFVARLHLFSNRSKFRAELASKLREFASKVRDVALKLRDVASKLRDIALKLRDVASKLRDVSSNLHDVALKLLDVTAHSGKVCAEGGYLFRQSA